ncbi:uncharacterized protein SPSK_02351 [Sporothrix schenckii 1099-18]|uniref:Uncharacterized protein n=1 Tax=Sporothrix schenckii 1099-18 TaxID=1397361 RepID=A0A0F2MAY5_SPOSC|nr:uncharacterized protein SPSK_02351 [Sporothrix schenckii 1099-18]KJR86807.1 hypothetical protein SPSK_02351 [Sporothrix schenckii 1099-18]
MARQKCHMRWWPAAVWLPLLLAAAAGPARANGGLDINTSTSKALVAPRIPGPSDGGSDGGSGDNVVELFRRLAAPLAAAAAEPNIMAADADEQIQQMLQAAVKRDEMRRAQGEAERDHAAPANAARQPRQTPPPALARRQDNSGQIQALSAQIQSISLVASSISQASRSVSQTSQQLAQQVTQLSQSTDRLSQSINQLQNSVQQAQQSAQSAQDASRQASQSASQAVSSAISSAESSANAAIASNMASLTSSASAIIAAASVSAASLAKAAASQVQSAQADATIARADAATQVQQAQGTAVSVTQAALAIVGAFVGSSLLTILAFYLVLRYKSNRKRRRTRLIATRGEIGYPKQQGGDGDGDGGNRGTYGYPIDLKDPPRPSMTGANAEGDGFDEKRPEAAYIRGMLGGSAGTTNKPGAGAGAGATAGADVGAGFGFGAFGSGSGSSISMAGGLPQGPFGRKGSGGANNNGNNNSINGRSSFSLFPKTPTGETGPANNAVPASQQEQPQQPVVSPSIYATGTSTMTNTLNRSNTTTNNPTRAQPSLQQWLREGTVSPFATLKRDSREVRAAGNGSSGSTGNNAAAGPIGLASTAGGPLERKQQQLRAMMKRSMGVGGVNAGGGGRVMRPGGSLPLRDN